ncbi:MAG: methyl-accepting chemotaxis protein [Treponema sp.]|nr:methyl-accepting chemotaxis protein [Treponema sp.]
MENSAVKGRQNSLRRRFIVFSVILFVLILIGSGAVFIFSMQHIVQEVTSLELVQDTEIEKIKLEASVNGEIAIALKMADSPIIIQHFLNPGDAGLRKIAFAEIEGYRKAFKSNTVFWASDKDKEFYFSEDNHYTIDPDDPNNYWYKMTLYQTDRYNFNINYNAEIKKIMLWINAPVFDANNTPIGLVGTGIDLTEFVNTVYQNNTNGNVLYFFNNNGEITGARDADLITNKVTLSGKLGKIGDDILARARNLASDGSQYFRAPEGIVAICSVPGLNWYITEITPFGISNVLGSSMTVLFLSMIAIIAAIFIIFNIFISGMLKPMNYMVDTLNQISVDWDMTRRLKLQRSDEIGRLGEFFNLTFEKMRELLVGIKEKTIALSKTGDKLTSYMDETRTDIDGISSNINTMRGQVLTQADKVNTTADSMGRIIEGLDKLNGHITVQAESVAQSSSAIEEMLANIQSVTQTLVKNTQNIHLLTESSEAGRTDLQKVSVDIQEIAKESEGLLQINSVMQNISSQTNLLAMNAAIEAAHAGESGRGFAVVADEIRKLAENSSGQSKTISAVLKKIKASIDQITKSTGIVLDRFQAIENEVQTVSEQETQIRNAMQEQGEGSRQILEAISRLNSVTGQVRNASADMTSESKDVMRQSDALKIITTEVSGSMDGMTHNAGEISDIINRVQDISAENQQNIGALGGDITRFKVE